MYHLSSPPSRLKDSDVTWLYGPLHTAAEWKPPPRHQYALSPATTAPARPNSPSSNQSRRSNAVAPYKPILKHRSISELLTSDLPVTSPIFSPIDSGDESEITDINCGDASIPLNPSPKRPALLHTKSDTLVNRWGSSRTFRKGSPSPIDAHEVTNGTRHRSSSISHLLSAGGAVRASHSQDSNTSEKSAASGSDHSQTRHRKKHISFNTFVEQWIAIDKPKKNASGYFGAIPEASWVDGRTNWVDETGFAHNSLSILVNSNLPLSYRYEEDHEDSEDEKVHIHCSQWAPNSLEPCVPAIREDSDSAGEEEDDDDDDDAIEIRSTSSRSSTLRPHKKPLSRSQSKVSTTSSSSSASTSTTSSSRSDASTLTTTDNTSSPSGSLSPTRRISSSSSIPRKNSSSSLLGVRQVYRRSSTTTLMSTYRPSLHRIHPPLPRSPVENNRSQHVTIAPIAPTFLKTTPTSSWTENFGDDGASSGDDIFAGWAWGVGGRGDVDDYTREDQDQAGGMQRRRSWTSGYGADNDGLASIVFGTGRGMGFSMRREKDEHSSDGTPVELVYVPPFEYDYPDEPEAEFEESPQEDGQSQAGEHEEVEDIELPVYETAIPSSSICIPINHQGRSNVPSVIVDEGPSTSSFLSRDKQRFHLPILEDEELAHDPYDYLGGPDMGDDYYYFSRRGGRNHEYSNAGATTSRGRTSNPKSSPRTSHMADRRQATREPEKNGRGYGEERQSRSRSRSQSRTPSPALLSPQNKPASAMGDSGPEGGKYKITSCSPSNGLLAPSSPRTFSQSETFSLPARGRQVDTHSRLANGISSKQDDRRGRSATRTSSSSSSWDRERGSSGSLSSTSPIGSLSPDGHEGSRRNSGSGVRSVLGSVLGGGRMDKEPELSRERRGRERERLSPRMLNAPPLSADQSVLVKHTDASFGSAASSSSSSNASTIVPKQVVHAEEISQKAAFTPSNSPVLPSWGTRTPTPTRIPSSSPLPSSPSTPSTIRTSSKLRPSLTLRPTSPSPAKPRTSFAAVVSPTVTSPPTSPTQIASAMGSHGENTIVSKAVDMVSTYLGLWGRERSASTPSSPS